MELFSIEFLRSSFANFRFLKTNSIFGIISFVVAELVIIGMLVVLVQAARKIRLMKKLQKETKLNLQTQSKNDGSKLSKEEFGKKI